MGLHTVSAREMTIDIEPEDSPKSNTSKNIKRGGKEAYYSDIVGDYIKDAITGAQHPWRIGTINEERFFRVVITCPSVDGYRKGRYDTSFGRGTHKAFYDSPEAYMKHNHCALDNVVIEAWHEQQQKFDVDM